MLEKFECVLIGFYGVIVHYCVKVYESVLIGFAVNYIQIIHHSQLKLPLLGCFM